LADNNKKKYPDDEENEDKRYPEHPYGADWRDKRKRRAGMALAGLLDAINTMLAILIFILIAAIIIGILSQ